MLCQGCREGPAKSKQGKQATGLQAPRLEFHRTRQQQGGQATARDPAGPRHGHPPARRLEERGSSARPRERPPPGSCSRGRAKAAVSLPRPSTPARPRECRRGGRAREGGRAPGSGEPPYPRGGEAGGAGPERRGQEHGAPKLGLACRSLPRSHDPQRARDARRARSRDARRARPRDAPPPAPHRGRARRSRTRRAGAAGPAGNQQAETSRAKGRDGGRGAPKRCRPESNDAGARALKGGVFGSGAMKSGPMFSD